MDLSSMYFHFEIYAAFADVSNLESSFSSCSSHGYDSSSIYHASSKTNVLLGYDEIAQRHIKNCKIAHININGLAGFKFAEVQMWLSSALSCIRFNASRAHGYRNTHKCACSVMSTAGQIHYNSSPLRPVFYAP